LPDEEQAMTDHRRKFVLVIGTGWANAAKRRVARMIGTTLADAGFGLIAGNSTGDRPLGLQTASAPRSS
jgi:hypothetical protein